jgi:hypothetical protein
MSMLCERMHSANLTSSCWAAARCAGVMLAKPNALERYFAHAVLADAKFGLLRRARKPPPPPAPPAGPPLADGSGTFTPWARMHFA